MKHQHYPGLEIDHDPVQERREWTIQRIAWALLYALLIGIILGLLGKGPLSDATISADDGSMRLEYEKFLRHNSAATLIVTLDAKADTVEMKLDSEYLRRIQITQVTPQPERVVASSDSVGFVFNARPGASVQVEIEYEPERVGVLHGLIAAGDGPRHTFGQFVYP